MNFYLKFLTLHHKLLMFYTSKFLRLTLNNSDHRKNVTGLWRLTLNFYYLESRTYYLYIWVLFFTFWQIFLEMLDISALNP